MTDEEVTEFGRRLTEVCRDSSCSIKDLQEFAEKAAEAAASVPDSVLIGCIKSNPSLTRFQKWRLCRKIRKERRP